MNDRIELAILAIGGSTHRPEACMCDPDVGAAPCPYCAEFDGLIEARRIATELEVAQAQVAAARLAADYWRDQWNAMTESYDAARLDTIRLDQLQTRGYHHLHHETGDCLGWEWTITSANESENDLRATIDSEFAPAPPAHAPSPIV